MIADDLLAAGLADWCQDVRVPPPQVFRVPYAVAPRVEFDDAGGGIRFPLDPLAVKLCPFGAREGSVRTFDATWGRRPYSSVLIVSDRRELGGLLVHAWGGDPNLRGGEVERWYYVYVMRGTRAWLPIYAGFSSHSLKEHDLHGMSMETEEEKHKLIGVQREVAGRFGYDIAPFMFDEDPCWDWKGWFDTANRAAALAALTLFSLLNAKNVHAEKVSPPRDAQQLRVRRKLPPLTSYHILKVAPFAAMRTTPQQHGAVLYHLPLHWVRGHFKTFTEARPLFGKYAGRFWWQPVLHGKDTSRRVEKDYDVMMAPHRV